MPFSITQLPSADKLCRTLSWPLLEQFFPRQRIEQLTESICGQTTRARKLTLVLVIWVLICWHLYLRHSLGAVFLKLSSVERWLGEQEPESLPTRAAWTYRRKQLGVRLLRAVFEHFCVPLATADTPGAFAFGLRLMAMDGTHALVKVIAAPCRASEACLARGLLPALKPGMLVLVDRGFISGALVEAIRARRSCAGSAAPRRLYPQRAGAPRWQLPDYPGPTELPGPVGSPAGARH